MCRGDRSVLNVTHRYSSSPATTIKIGCGLLKRIAAILTVLFLLGGCSTRSGEIDRAISLRNKLMKSNGIEFDVDITADYGD